MKIPNMYTQSRDWIMKRGRFVQKDETIEILHPDTMEPVKLRQVYFVGISWRCDHACWIRKTFMDEEFIDSISKRPGGATKQLVQFQKKVAPCAMMRCIYGCYFVEVKPEQGENDEK